ncbi:WD40-repeat-containing domain protein [Lipomyces tetrasporus]|uniref:DDB1- and CUL4-associated factor 13 n=1 Tax=Lipomyces tetrasporus TaxID=54092 RepID=A0AAD7VQG9_9ASCO|nr:WD40-repeat-containing domain protein [Lipomyces tetrasporus]KAJ8097584.1 WD40-repeat-containing domain protein [Lipomyces tetrasporus]
MKVKALSRSSDVYLPARNSEVSRLPRNLDPDLHPFERAREYTRALNATKLERVFAAPFVGQLGNGHVDGVYCIAKNMRRLNSVASGSGDGVIKYWDLSSREEEMSFTAHQGVVKGLAVTLEGNLLSCSMDNTVKLWNVMNTDHGGGPTKTFLGSSGFTGIDHHRSNPVFVTSSNAVQIWDENRSKPTADLSWGADNVNAVKFNQTEQSIIASAGSDRSIVIHDIRSNAPVQKLVMLMRTNAICWNPIEAFNFAAANEDHNVYLYDMRKLTRSLNVYKDHVSAVMDVDFSPTGQELATGSYDRTLRIYRVNEGHSRDVYHTKRMQRIFCVRFTMDARYIISGSDEGNIRLWRADAAARSNIKSARERSKLEYDAALKMRYKNMPEIRRISRHRHLPKPIKTASETKRIEVSSIKRKEDNMRRRSKKGTVPYPKEREKQVIGVAIKETENNV